MNEVLRVRAAYSDSAGFSQALLASLADDEANAFRPDEAANFLV